MGWPSYFEKIEERRYESLREQAASREWLQRRKPTRKIINLMEALRRCRRPPAVAARAPAVAGGYLTGPVPKTRSVGCFVGCAGNAV